MTQSLKSLEVAEASFRTVPLEELIRPTPITVYASVHGHAQAVVIVAGSAGSPRMSGQLSQ